MLRTIPKPGRCDSPACLVASTAAMALLSGCQSVTETEAKERVPFEQPIVDSGLEITMIPIPPGDGVKGFWISQNEIDWDTFDAFVFDLDELPVKGTPEAETRPTRPYMLVDRGFGHAGYPAISMSRRGAEAFCLWLSEESGRNWRLPTTMEWEHACQLGNVPASAMAQYAWDENNADWTTHPVGTLEADAIGLHDMHGNIAEWAIAPDGSGVIMGGSFISPPEEITCGSRQPYTKDWNESDPQIPKSIWWLADGPFIGFRVVCDSNP